MKDEKKERKEAEEVFKKVKIFGGI